jgi:predicted MPP superfamily phosphohydrolase
MIPLRLIIFGLTVNSIWIGVTIYLYKRLTGPYDLNPIARNSARALALFVAVIVPSAFLTRLVRDWSGQQTVAYLGFATMGSIGALATLLILRDVTLWLWGRWQRFNQAEPVDPARREFLVRATTAGVAATSAGIAAAGIRGALQPPKVEPVEVPIEGLPADLEGLRIAQVSDIHVGATATAKETQRIASIVNSLEPDLIAVTGDLVDGPVKILAPDLAPLFDMKAPMGVHFCTGNHEYYSGWKPWCEHLEANGWKVHLNGHQLYQRGAGSVMIAGIPDLRATRFEPDHACDIDKTCKDAESADVKVLLAHQPRSLKDIPEGRFDLILSGHTHGGQFFPFTVLIHLFQPLVAGLYRRKNMWVYVNRGTAHWGPPLRLGARQEVTLLTLKRA